MKAGIGIVLIVGALVLGYLGITNLQKSSNSVELLGIEITAADNKGKEIATFAFGQIPCPNCPKSKPPAGALSRISKAKPCPAPLSASRNCAGPCRRIWRGNLQAAA